MKFVLRNSGLGFAVQCSSSAVFSTFDLLKIHSSPLSSSQRYNVRTLWRSDGACVVSGVLTALTPPTWGGLPLACAVHPCSWTSVSRVLPPTHHVQLGCLTGISNVACPKLSSGYLPWSHKPGLPTSMTSSLSIPQTKKIEIILDFFLISNSTSEPSMEVGGRVTAYRDVHVLTAGTWECALWRPKGPRTAPS